MEHFTKEDFIRLLENAQDIVYRYDFLPEPRFRYVSRSVNTILGYTPAQFYADPDFDLKITHPDHLEKRKNLFNDLPTTILLKTIHQDQRVVTLEHHLTYLYTETGSLLGVEGIARDVTGRERRKAEQEFLIHASRLLSGSLDYETTLKSIAELAVPYIADWIAIDLFDEEGQLQQLVLAHPHAEKQKLGEAFRRNYLATHERPNPALAAAESRESILIPSFTEADLRAAAENEFTLDMLLNKMRPKSMLYVPLLLRDKVLGVLSFITEEPGRALNENDLRLAEELASRAAVAIENARLYRDVQETQERFEVTLSSIGDAVIAVDNEGCITFMNEVARRLTGWQKNEAQGVQLDKVFQIINEETRETVESPFAKVIRTEALVGLANHTILINKAGQEIPIDDSGAPIRNWRGEVIGVVLVFRDITERKALEGHRQEVAVLEERQRLARELHDAVTQTLFSSTLLAESLPRLSNTSPERLHSLLNQLYRLNRAASAEMRNLLNELRPANLVDNEIPHLIEQLAYAAMGRKKFKVDMHLDTHVRVPEFVKFNLYRITQEALNNVVKHSQASEVIIKLEDQAEQIHLLIKDNGRGFDPADVEARELGLTIIRERTQAIGGSCEISSTPGQGTEIAVRWKPAAQE